MAKIADAASVLALITLASALHLSVSGLEGVAYNFAIRHSRSVSVINYHILKRYRVRRAATNLATQNATHMEISTVQSSSKAHVTSSTTQNPAVTSQHFLHSGTSTVETSTTTQRTTTSTTKSTTSNAKLISSTIGSKSSQRASATTPMTTKVIRDDHRYYRSVVIQNEVEKHWVNLENYSQKKHHFVLSNSHRMAAPISLSFMFRFYGHNITNVTVATGGFLYMSPFLHKWLTVTQYIAPLMANFDTKIGNFSRVSTLDTGDMMVIHWNNLHLQDQNSSSPFDFQTILYKNGSIKFAYQQVPISPIDISQKNHPVKIGLSDAYYVDTYEHGGIRRTIYEYHRVEVDKTKIHTNTVVLLHPLPTCNLATDCDSCLFKQTTFICRWCPAIKRCSDGIDWHHQSWVRNGCPKTGFSEKYNCMATAKMGVPTATVLSTRTRAAVKPSVPAKIHTSFILPMSTQASRMNITQSDKKCPERQSSKFSAVIVIPVVIIVALLIIAGAWCYYAYTHPTTPLGIWLMEHRPSQMKAKMANMKFWKHSTPTGDKYRIESQA